MIYIARRWWVAFALSASSILSGQSLSPTTPAREYIHFNGAVIATENNVQGVVGETPTPRAGFHYVRTLTIRPHAPAIGGDLTNFPIVFSTTLSDLSSTSYGGQVNSPQGYDIVFTGDAGGTQLLHWEIENYNPATGSIVCWIQAPVLSHAANTYIYMSYGDSSITAAQSNPASVWDSNYAAVYHFSGGTGSTLSFTDSTANGNNGSANGSAVLSATPRVGGAVQFSNSSVSIPMNGFPSGSEPTTMEGWFSVQSLPSSGIEDSYLVSYGQPVQAEANGIFFEAKGSGQFDAGWDSHAPGDTGPDYLPSNTLFPFNAWHHIVTTYVCTDPCPTPSGTVNVYVDGHLDATRGPNDTGATDQATVNRIATLGAWMCSTDAGVLYPCYAMTGSADEIRISKTNRSADWVQAEYQNQSNPAGFVTVGSPVAAP